MIALRKEHPALRTENISFVYESIEHGVLASIRWSEEGDKVIAIYNLSGQPLKDYQVPLEEQGVWRDWTSGTEIEITDNHMVLDLPEREARIFVRV
jgi:hypothetical protein